MLINRKWNVKSDTFWNAIASYEPGRENITEVDVISGFFAPEGRRIGMVLENLETLTFRESVVFADAGLDKAAFLSSSALKTVEILTPACGLIDDTCFMLSSISKFKAVNVTYFGSRAFGSTHNIEICDCPQLQEVNANTFSRSAISTLTFPNLEVVPFACFESCRSLASFSGASVLQVAPQGFGGTSSLTNLSIPNVQEIAEYAFTKAFLRVDLDFPRLTRIGMGAFDNSNGIHSIHAPSLTAMDKFCFMECPALESFEAFNVESVPEKCFYSCFELSSVVVPKVSLVGENAFAKCSSLREADFPSCVRFESKCFSESGLRTFSGPKAEMFANSCFKSCVNLEEVLAPMARDIGRGCFANCAQLKSVVLKFSEIETVAEEMFSCCVSLHDIAFPNAKSIAHHAFQNCANLSVVTADLVTIIGVSAFYGCVRLTSCPTVKVGTLQENALYSCISLTHLSFPVLVSAGVSAISGCTILKHLDMDSVVELGSMCCEFCVSLEQLCLPVQVIGDNCFASCIWLQKVIFNNVTVTGSNSFRGCLMMREIELNSLPDIAVNGFYGLSLVKVSCALVTMIPSYCFASCTDLVRVFVPKCEHVGMHAFRDITGNGTAVNLRIESYVLTEISESAFLHTPYVEILSYNVERIGDMAFAGVLRLRIGSFAKLKELGDYAFEPTINVLELETGQQTHIKLEGLETAGKGFMPVSLKNTFGLSFPNLTKIGDESFNGTMGLTFGRFNSLTEVGNLCFNNLPMLTGFVAPKLSKIGSYFLKETRLTNISLPSLEATGDYAFAGASSVAHFDLPKVTQLGSYCFHENKVVSVLEFNKITKIGIACFSECSNLTRITGIATTNIPSLVFSQCTHLTEIEFKYHRTSIGTYAFQHCQALTSLNFSDLVTLSPWAFSQCHHLVSIDIGKVTTVQSFTFYNCTSLQSITFTHAYELLDSAFELCTSLSSISSETVQKLGKAVFMKCSSLTSVSFPAAREIDGDSVFNGCTSLVSVDLSSLTTIPPSVKDSFSQCSSLDLIHLPSTPPEAFHFLTFSRTNRSFVTISGESVLNITLCLPNKGDYSAYVHECTGNPGCDAHHWNYLDGRPPANYNRICHNSSDLSNKKLMWIILGSVLGAGLITCIAVIVICQQNRRRQRLREAQETLTMTVIGDFG